MYWQISSALILMTLFGVMAWLIVHARTETIYRPLAMLAFFSGVPAVTFSFWLTLGTALPLGNFFIPYPAGHHPILGHKSVPKVGVFLLLDMGDNSAPAFVMVPWDYEFSKKMEGMDPEKDYEFSWNMHRPLVTDGDLPDRFFEPKLLDENGAPTMNLAPGE